MVPESTRQSAYFARRRFVAAMKQWLRPAGWSRSGTDITAAISDDREDRA